MKKSHYSSAKRRRTWTPEEDLRLRKCVEKHGQCNWHLVPSRAGIERCRKSCRMRWLNYLCPNIKRGEFTDDEDDLIFRLHKLLGNRWSLIAGRLPGRTANDVKNHWNCHLVKKVVAANENITDVHEKVRVIKPQPRILTKDIQNCADKHRPENEKGMLLMTPPRPTDKPVRRWESSLSNEEEDNTVFPPRDVDEVVQQLPSGNCSWFEGMKLHQSPAEGSAFGAEGCDWEIFSTCEDFYHCDWFDT